jgi:glucokinase
MARLCVDFGGTNVKMGLARGEDLLETAEFPVSGSADDLAAVEAAAKAMAARAGSTIETVAMAVPGLVNVEGTRLVLAHGKYDWMMGADLTAWARRAFGAAGFVENDARAALMGEVSTGVAAGETNAMILVLGTGIGTAAMIDGALVHGASGAAGNLGGHITIDWKGPICNCGNVGCAEVFGGSWALRARVGEFVDSSRESSSQQAWRSRLADASPLGFAEVFERASAGDSIARDARDAAIRAWSVVAVSGCHLIEPDVIVIAGGVARAADQVVPVLSEYVRQHIWQVLPMPRIVVTIAPEMSVLRGLIALRADLG